MIYQRGNELICEYFPTTHYMWFNQICLTLLWRRTERRANVCHQPWLGYINTAPLQFTPTNTWATTVVPISQRFTDPRTTEVRSSVQWGKYTQSQPWSEHSYWMHPDPMCQITHVALSFGQYRRIYQSEWRLCNFWFLPYSYAASKEFCFESLKFKLTVQGRK